jgi:pantothenate kinase-related protein Tda10
VYVTGPQGSGKSFWTAQYARNWKEQNPRPPKPDKMSDADYAWWSPGQVFLFSQVGEDEALDSVRRRALRVD